MSPTVASNHERVIGIQWQISNEMILTSEIKINLFSRLGKVELAYQLRMSTTLWV
jgi:hypothetical protein